MTKTGLHKLSKHDKRTQPRAFIFVWRDTSAPPASEFPDFTSPTLEFMVCTRGPNIRHAGQHGLVGGRVDPGESPAEALCREVQEECGLTLRGSKMHTLGEVVVKRRPVNYFAINAGFVIGEFTPTDEIESIKFITLDDFAKAAATKGEFHYSTLNVPALAKFRPTFTRT